MSVLEQEKISRIKVLLKVHPKGLTITDIASKLKMNRNSAAKYLEILLISGVVESQSYGTAKVFYLTHRLPISALVSIASDLVVTLDEKYRILFVNNGFCNLFAVQKEDAVGNHIVDLFKNGIVSDVLPGIFSDVIADPEKVHEVRLTRDTGDLFFRIKSMKTVFDDGSRGLTIIMEDVTREKRDQIELEAKEARYRGIIEDQTEFVIRFDPKGILTFCNTSYSQYLGKKPDELYGIRFADTICERDKAVFSENLKSLCPDKPVTSFECRSVRPPRQDCWISWTIRALFDGNTKPVEYQAVGQDITEKKEASEKLHRYIAQMEFFSKKLQQFIELPPDGKIFSAIGAGLLEILPDAAIAVSSYDPETTTVTVKAVFNERDLDIISRSIGRYLIGMKIQVGDTAPPEGFLTGRVYNPHKNLYNIFFQQVPGEICTEIENALNLGEFYSIGMTWQGTLFGNITFALRKGQELKEGSLVETYTRAASIFLQRSLAENALRESENLYRSVIENIQDGFFRSDLDGTLIMVSPSWASLLGYPSVNKCLGRNLSRDFYQEPGKWREFLQALTKNGSVRDYEVVLKKKDGTPVYASTNSQIYYSKEGAILGIEGIFRDISERRTADEKIRQYISDMAFLSERLLDFIAMEPSENIFAKITSDLKVMIPGSMVLVNSFDPKTGILTVRSAAMREPQRDAITRALGKELVGSEFQIDARGLAAFRTGMLHNPNLPLFDIVFGTIPEPVCTTLESELGIGEIYSIGFVRGGEVLGNATIFLDRGVSIPNLKLVQMYTHEAAIALQRYIAEEARRESDEIFYNIAQTSPLPIALIEPDGTYLYINESFTWLFGYDLTDFHTGREWFRLAFPDPAYRRMAIAVWKSDRAESRAGQPFIRTYPVRCRDSTVKEVIFRPVTLSDGKLCIVYEDITGRKKAEQVHRLLSLIVECTGDAIIGKDSSGMVISWNRAAERLYGYSQDEMIGQHISRIIPPIKKEEMDAIFTQIQQGETVTNLETERVDKNGRVFDVSVTISPITDEGGCVIGASTIARDITTRKAEARMRENEDLYRSHVDNIAVGIYRSTGDPAGHFIWGNSSLVRILGYPSLDKLREVEVANLFVEQDGRMRLLDDLKKEGFVKNREIALRKADGGFVCVLVTALARFDKSGGLSCINGIVEDITSQKLAEQQIQIVNKEMLDILAFIPYPVVIVDGGNAVVSWNPAMEQLTGIKQAEVIGNPDYDHHFPFYFPGRPSLFSLFDAPGDEIERYYPGAVREGTSIIAEVRTMTLQGDPPPSFTLRASPLSDPQGARTGAMAIIQPASSFCKKE